MADELMTYKGFPLVRSGNTIIYGNFYDPYVVQMTILASKQVGDTDVPTRISLRLINTDESLPPQARLASPPLEQKSMTEAMFTAYIWLTSKVKPEA